MTAYIWDQDDIGVKIFLNRILDSPKIGRKILHYFGKLHRASEAGQPAPEKFTQNKETQNNALYSKARGKHVKETRDLITFSPRVTPGALSAKLAASIREHPPERSYQEKAPMTRKIRIVTGSVEVEADLLETPTAELLWESLPFEEKTNVWGEEIYFAIPLQTPVEPTAREEMEIGEIAYWPPGNAFCIFFGQTPSSTDEAPRAASPVNPLGRIIGDAKAFSSVAGGANISITRAQ